MFFDWFLLALFSAMALASADAFTKKWFSGLSGMDLLAIRFGAAAALLFPCVLWQGWPQAAPAFWGWLACLIPLELAAMWLYSKAITESPLSHTLPYLALTPLFTIVTGYLFLGEHVSMIAFLGIALICIGTFILNADQPSHETSHRINFWLRPFYAFVNEPGARNMALAAFIYSLTSVISKQAMLYNRPETFGVFYFFLIGTSALLLIAVISPKSFAVFKSKPLPICLIALAMSAMVISHFLSLHQIEAASMIAVKRTSILFGILIGAIFFQERRVGWNLVAAALMLLGASFIRMD